MLIYETIFTFKKKFVHPITVCRKATHHNNIIICITNQNIHHLMTICSASFEHHSIIVRSSFDDNSTVYSTPTLYCLPKSHHLQCTVNNY